MWLRKTRPVLIVVGLALLVGSLVGARALTGGSNAAASGEPAPPPRAGGLTVLGTVDSEKPQVAYGLPPVLQSGTISEVLVNEGDVVKVDQPLYKFDAPLQQATVDSAKAAVLTAKTKVKETEEGKKRHARNIEVAEKGVKALRSQAAAAESYQELVKKNTEDAYKLNMFAPETWAGRLNIDATYADARNKYSAAYDAWQLKIAELEALRAADPQVLVEQAEAAVKQAEVALGNAQKMVELCTVKASTAGTVEHVTINRGTTLGVGTRTPALWLIPSGNRVVRAEVEAEFAHRVGPDREGKSVTISDHSDATLTYSGVVRHIGGTFLPKRSGGENLLGNDTRVIEVLIDVPEPAPEKKPPLRVGQRVRVNLGQ